MSKITVLNKSEEEDSWNFEVSVASNQFKVNFSKSYYQSLTDGNITPEELVKHSFEFLLKREPVTSIIPEFKLKVINTYFPDYENLMKSKFKS